MAGGGIGGFDDDEGVSQAAGQGDLAGRQHLTAAPLDQHQPAACRHRQGFRGIAKGACIAGQLLAFKPRDRKHIIQIIAELRGKLAATFGDQSQIIAVKQHRADRLWHG